MSIDIEKKILKGFIVDRFAITKRLSEGFKSEYFEDPKTTLILNAIFDIYEGRGETEVLDFQTLYRHLEKKGVMDNEIKNFLDELEKIETPNLALLISYIDILRIRNGERRLINIADEITEFVERRGPQKVEDISNFLSKCQKSYKKLLLKDFIKNSFPQK